MPLGPGCSFAPIFWDMNYAPTVEPVTLDEVRAEMENLVSRRNARGAFHPAEYWRWNELGRVEESLLGISP